VGKTSLLEAILGIYPQVIVHHDIMPGISKQCQLVYIKVDCPQDASIRGLCSAVFYSIDNLLGTTYLREWSRSRCTINAFLQCLYQVINNLQLGYLVLDELQHLSAAKAGGEDRMLNLLVNLINGVGIPLVLSGTWALLRIVEKQMRNARRASGVGTVCMRRLQRNDPMWKLLVNNLWTYQWVRNPAPLTKEIEDVLYDCTQGLRNGVVKLCMASQYAAIDDESETVTAATLRETYDREFQPMHEAMSLLRVGTKDDDPIFDSLLGDGKLRKEAAARAAYWASHSNASENERAPTRRSRRKPVNPVDCDRTGGLPVGESLCAAADLDLRFIEGCDYNILLAHDVVDRNASVVSPL